MQMRQFGYDISLRVDPKKVTFLVRNQHTYLHTQSKQLYFVNKMYDSSSKMGHDFSK